MFTFCMYNFSSYEINFMVERKMLKLVNLKVKRPGKSILNYEEPLQLIF
jgi:hypothetical protein